MKKEEAPVWKWWEEEPLPEGVKWRTLEHKGVLFQPPYEPLPDHVKFYYDGKPVKLSEAAEEIATFYAKMLEHDYTTKEIFNNNFFHDWRLVSKITRIFYCIKCIYAHNMLSKYLVIKVIAVGFDVWLMNYFHHKCVFSRHLLVGK